MLGGVTMNGEQLYTQAQEEQNKLEEEIQLAFELPINYLVQGRVATDNNPSWSWILAATIPSRIHCRLYQRNSSD